MYYFILQKYKENLRIATKNNNLIEYFKDTGWNLPFCHIKAKSGFICREQVPPVIERTNSSNSFEKSKLQK